MSRYNNKSMKSFGFMTAILFFILSVLFLRASFNETVNILFFLVSFVLMLVTKIILLLTTILHHLQKPSTNDTIANHD